MKLSPQEKAEHRAAFRQMTPAKKLDHIFTYYKIPIAVALFLLIFVGDMVYRQVTRKEPLVYLAITNISVGEELETALTEGFVAYTGAAPKKNEVPVYRQLYLSRDPGSENHQYAYASRLKLMASIQAQELDLVLMNRESYDYLSQEGYLYDLPSVLPQDGALSRRLEPYLRENTVILEDNSIEYNLNEAETYEAVTAQAVNGVEVSSLPLFRDAGFSDAVYLGVIGNSPCLPAVFSYLEYLLGA